MTNGVMSDFIDGAQCKGGGHVVNDEWHAVRVR
jgi:hypothetical protein